MTKQVKDSYKKTKMMIKLRKTLDYNLEENK